MEECQTVEEIQQEPKENIYIVLYDKFCLYVCPWVVLIAAHIFLNWTNWGSYLVIGDILIIGGICIRLKFPEYKFYTFTLFFIYLGFLSVLIIHSFYQAGYFSTLKKFVEFLSN